MKKLIYMLLLAAGTALLPAIASAQTVVIVHPDNPVGQLKPDEVREYLRLKAKKWADGSRVVLFMTRKPEAVHEKFFEQIGENPLALKKLWLRSQLTGAGKAPKGLRNDTAVVKRVAAEAGAMAFVAESAVTKKVKIIARFK